MTFIPNELKKLCLQNESHFVKVSVCYLQMRLDSGQDINYILLILKQYSMDAASSDRYWFVVCNLHSSRTCNIYGITGTSFVFYSSFIQKAISSASVSIETTKNVCGWMIQCKNCFQIYWCPEVNFMVKNNLCHHIASLGHNELTLCSWHWGIHWIGSIQILPIHSQL